MIDKRIAQFLKTMDIKTTVMGGFDKADTLANIKEIAMLYEDIITELADKIKQQQSEIEQLTKAADGMKIAQFEIAKRTDRVRIDQLLSDKEHLERALVKEEQEVTRLRTALEDKERELYCVHVGGRAEEFDLTRSADNKKKATNDSVQGSKNSSKSIGNNEGSKLKGSLNSAAKALTTETTNVEGQKVGQECGSSVNSSNNVSAGLSQQDLFPAEYLQGLSSKVPVQGAGSKALRNESAIPSSCVGTAQGLSAPTMGGNVSSPVVSEGSSQPSDSGIVREGSDQPVLTSPSQAGQVYDSGSLAVSVPLPRMSDGQVPPAEVTGSFRVVTSLSPSVEQASLQPESLPSEVHTTDSPELPSLGAVSPQEQSFVAPESVAGTHAGLMDAASGLLSAQEEHFRVVNPYEPNTGQSQVGNSSGFPAVQPAAVPLVSASLGENSTQAIPGQTVPLQQPVANTQQPFVAQNATVPNYANPLDSSVAQAGVSPLPQSAFQANALNQPVIAPATVTPGTVAFSPQATDGKVNAVLSDLEGTAKEKEKMLDELSSVRKRLELMKKRVSGSGD